MRVAGADDHRLTVRLCRTDWNLAKALMTTARDDSPTSNSGLVHGQLCYLQLPAVDVTASARFYERVFGWRVDPPDSGFEAPALIGQWIDERPASPDGGPVGWIFVHDIEATLRVAEAAGATGCEGPT